VGAGLEAEELAVVRAVQRRACLVVVGDGALLVLSRRGVPLAPNALTVDLTSHVTFEEQGFRPGQLVSFAGTAPSSRHADWVVKLDGATSWEPRPRVRAVDPQDLADRMRTIRAAVVADGAGESL